MLKDSILCCIGQTPIVRLSKLYRRQPVDVFAKMEMLNPGGSIKDRPAKYIVEQGLLDGTFNAHSHIIESSSGNFAIALAMVCKQYGLRFTCVVDPKISPTNLKIIQCYGANIEMVTDLDNNGGYLETRIKRVNQLLKEIPGAAWINQYANPRNWQSHYYGEAQEILNQIDEPIDYLVIGASTSGTLLGIARRLRQRWPKLKIVAVDAVGSVLFGTPAGPRELPGIGASRVPELLKPEEFDQVIHVDDYESAIACRRLLRSEGIFAGGSSGSALAAIDKLLAQENSPKRILTLFPDRGDRYLELVYDDQWLDRAAKRHKQWQMQYVNAPLSFASASTCALEQDRSAVTA